MIGWYIGFCVGGQGFGCLLAHITRLVTVQREVIQLQHHIHHKARALPRGIFQIILHGKLRQRRGKAATVMATDKFMQFHILLPPEIHFGWKTAPKQPCFPYY